MRFIEHVDKRGSMNRSSSLWKFGNALSSCRNGTLPGLDDMTHLIIRCSSLDLIMLPRNFCSVYSIIFTLHFNFWILEGTRFCHLYLQA